MVLALNQDTAGFSLQKCLPISHQSAHTRLNLLWHKTCFKDNPPPLQPAPLVGKMREKYPHHLKGAEKSGERTARNLATSLPLSPSSSSFP